MYIDICNLHVLQKVIKQEIFAQIALDRTFEGVANKKACVHAHQMSIIPQRLTKCFDPRC